MDQNHTGLFKGIYDISWICHKSGGFLGRLGGFEHQKKGASMGLPIFLWQLSKGKTWLP
jgi:hypothetical protein